MYLARDLELGVYRAVKELPLNRKREAKLLRLLDYPFLPAMTDYTEQGDHCYLVMEYIRGKSLRQYLEDGRIFTAEEIIETGRKVLQIFGYLHSRKPAVYYGDLKPDNLMMTEEGELYLVDFGSAVLGYERQYQDCSGTKGYASPEQYQGQIGSASDIYTLGRTLEALCGKKKFRYFIQYPGLGRFIGKCCRRQPEKRWKNASEAEQALNALRPLTVKLWNILIPVMGVLLLFIAVSMKFQERSGNPVVPVHLPELDQALSPVTAWYFSMPFRSGGVGVREEMIRIIEDSLARLGEEYKDRQSQERIRLMIARNRLAEDNIMFAEAGVCRLNTEERKGQER